ncbi:MAG: hypothetical protein BMS9Abin26_1516 [Gammaproteobacteria bacterium]|nr:MAG: hypothetical protein BMS9Abin26_1516 [Gammaproteobacteria bacterium]
MSKTNPLTRARKNKAQTLLQGGQLPQAARILTEICAKDKRDLDSWFTLAMIHAQLDELGDAIECFQHIINLDPNHLDAMTNLGVALFAQDHIDEAQQYLQRAANASVEDEVVYYNLACTYQAQGNNIDAIKYFEKAHALDPSNTDCLINLGVAYKDSEQYDMAIATFQKAMVLKPESPIVLSNLGITNRYIGNMDVALDYCRKALELDPDYEAGHNNLATAELVHGNYAEGWKEYEWRLKDKPHAHRFRYPRWNNEPLQGKTILIHGEQGLGDEIMFASCLPDIIEKAKQCLIHCDPRLASLYTRSFPAATVHGGVRSGDDDWCRDSNIDYQIPVGSLPLTLRNRLDDFPQHDGYLQADPQRVDHWKDRLDALGAGKKIGISWRGGTPQTRMHLRSIPLEQLLPILGQDAHFISLQYTACADEIEHLQQQHGISIHHWQEAIDDYDETAAMVTALDKVISIQTSLVHLCGALGQQAWVLVPGSAEWRYLLKGNRVPWYPSVRIYRQAIIGQWQQTINTLAADLGKELADGL